MIKNALSANPKRQKHHYARWRVIFAYSGKGKKGKLCLIVLIATFMNSIKMNAVFSFPFRLFFFKKKGKKIAKNEVAFLASFFDY